ncbi:MAG: TRAP transporter substrate-binding protein DctP, partial [Candidatus Thermoplasmatota archaeon]|nr:TRAP transporter substrate-binding protein DctP [Candidatus Thermoplasmatota archaeon]
MNKNRLILIILIMTILMMFVLTSGAQNEVYQWKMASAEVMGDPSSIFGEEYAKLVEEKSNGKIKIEVLPYGSLGGEKDIVELTQMGDVQLCSVSSAWVAGYVPQLQVFSLQYLWPKENVAEILYDVTKNGESIKLLEASCRKKGLNLLSLHSTGWMEISSNIPINSPDDCKGIKHRVMGNPLLIEAYNNYGFNTVTLDYGEIYGGLQTNLIDSQIQPMYCMYSMRFFEVQKYMTNMWNEMLLDTLIINSNVFD